MIESPISIPIPDFVFPPDLPANEILGMIDEITRSPRLRHAGLLMWDKMASSFAAHKREDFHPGRHIEGKHLLEKIYYIVNSNGQIQQVVDFACGSGDSTQSVAAALDRACSELNKPKANKIIGIDFSPSMIEEANASGLVHDQRVSFFTPSSFLIEQFLNQIDLVVSIRSLDDVQNITQILEFLFKMLKPGGTLLFSISHPLRNSQYINGNNQPYPLGAYIEKFQGETIRLRAELDSELVDFNRSILNLLLGEQNLGPNIPDFLNSFLIIKYCYNLVTWRLLLENAGFILSDNDVTVPIATDQDPPEIQAKYGPLGRPGAAFFLAKKPI